MDPETLELVLSRSTNWRGFLSDIGAEQLLPEAHRHRRLGYNSTIHAGPIPVRVMGLDSAWLCGDDSDPQNILLTEDQILLHGTDDTGAPLDGLRIALLHHPLSMLRDHGNAQSLLSDYSDLVLHGHIHDPQTEATFEPDRRLLTLAVGCLCEGSETDRHVNGFQVVTLHLDAAGKPAELELDLWGWSRRGHWHLDSSVYEAAPHGHLHWVWNGHSWETSSA
jgi:hypothetical protein